MKVIKYIQLFGYLTKEENLSVWQAYLTIQEVRKLPVDYKAAVLHVLEGKTPDIEAEGVTITDIMEKDHLHPVRAILLLDWIRREPAVAVRYMSRERLHAPQKVTDDDKKQLAAALQRLRGSRNSDTPKQKRNESDITIEQN